MLFFSKVHLGFQFSDYFTRRSAGARTNGSGSIVNPDTRGNYWSASPYSSTEIRASWLNLNSGNVNVNNNGNRADGFSVRCVRAFTGYRLFLKK